MARKDSARPNLATSQTTGDKLLTVREVSARLTLSRSTLWRMARRGQLPAPINLTPTRIAWRESDVAAWITSRTDATGR